MITIKKNIKLNSNFTKVDNKFKCIINKEFFENPKEVVFRSMGEILQKISGNYYAARGKSMMNLLRRIKSKKFNKMTLSGCIIEKINNSWIIYDEKSKKI